MRASLLVGILLAIPLPGQVKITQGTDRIRVDIDNHPFTEFFIGGEAPKPYMHPLRAASGTIVTRHYPMKTVAGESGDHPHHRGLWIGHGMVNGFDFWANEPSTKESKGGKVTLKQINGFKSGKDFGTVSATFNLLTPQGDPLLTEVWNTVFYSDPKVRRMDFDIRLTPSVKVTFGDTKEGTFAIRLADSLSEKRGGRMVNAEGAETEKNVWGKRSNWVDYYGGIEGEKLGIAILDHPGNPRHPARWHSRGYGLFAVNPIGEADFVGDKTKDGTLTIEPGHELRFRYRVVIHPGDVHSAGIVKMYKQYSEGR